MDGKPEPILRAYGFFMTVAVKGGGSHEVDFRYEPVSFRLGLFVSLVVFGFFLVSLAKNFSLLL
jgi:uncharacterized membrane protein YfhO